MYKLIDSNFGEKELEIMETIKRGGTLIYPTDTIYGLGGDATNEKVVQKIREIKGRETKPFSVIAPSKDWIRYNCVVTEKELVRLPGPYTLFCRLKNEEAVCRGVNPMEKSVGVRIPKHWFSEVVARLGRPLITTSVNKSEESYMTRLDDVDKLILTEVDLVVYEGEKKGEPSIKIDLRMIE